MRIVLDVAEEFGALEVCIGIGGRVTQPVLKQSARISNIAFIDSLLPQNST